MSESVVATIAYSGEAHDPAAEHFASLHGYTVTVHTHDGETFDAELGAVDTDERGIHRVSLRRWEDGEDEPTGLAFTLSIWDEPGGIARIVVL